MVDVFRSRGRVGANSGYKEEEARRHFADDATTGFLHKPYAAQKLEETVREILQQVRNSRDTLPADGHRPGGAPSAT